MSPAAHSEQTAPSERGCRCLLLRWWCHCKFSASVADCGAILNGSVFPECLWLIWHFSLKPSQCLCSRQLCRPPALSLYPSLRCSNSRLTLFKHRSSRSFFFFLIPFTDILCHHFLISLNIHQVSLNQREPLSPPCTKRMHSASRAGSEISDNSCHTASFCRSSHLCTTFCGCAAWFGCCLFPVDWIWNVIRSDSEAGATGLWIV